MGCTEFSLFYPPLTPLSVLFLGLILTTLVESPRTTVSGCSFSSSFLISLMLLGLAFSGQKADLLGCCILTNSYSMVLLCKSVCVSYQQSIPPPFSILYISEIKKISYDGRLFQITVHQPILFYQQYFELLQIAMLPVKANNNPARITRARSRKNEANKLAASNCDAFGKPSKSRGKSKNKKANCANEESDTSVEPEPTINTGLVHRKGPQPNDKKTTIKKPTFESKPIIKDVAKRISTYSKQYTPEYFTTILEYMIEKEVRSGTSPTIAKINKWRNYITRQRQIEDSVRKEVQKMKNRILTGRKQFKERQEEERKKIEAMGKQFYDDLLNEVKSENPPFESNSDQSEPLSISNNSCPENVHRAPPTELQNQKNLSDEWECRYEQFCILVQQIFELLGQTESNNTLYPACYIFYIMTVSDVKVFDFLKETKKPTTYQQYTSYRNRVSKTGGEQREYTPIQMVEYYTIISILIATKYHEIYPASLVDLIDSVDYKLSYDYAIKIQGQVLQMLNFSQFFTQNQHRFLKMFTLVLSWTSIEQSICQFILESGLCHPKLYTYSPMFKAAVVIGLYEEQFAKSQEKFMLIKGLCPGLTFEIVGAIKKCYVEAIVYNTKNKLEIQKNKFFIYDHEINMLARTYSSK